MSAPLPVPPTAEELIATPAHLRFVDLTCERGLLAAREAVGTATVAQMQKDDVRYCGGRAVRKRGRLSRLHRRGAQLRHAG
jgi:hypothetical protein